MAYLRLKFKVSEHSKNDYRTTFKLFYAKRGLKKPHIKSSENYQQQPQTPETNCDKSNCLPQSIHCSYVPGIKYSNGRQPAKRCYQMLKVYPKKKL